MLIAVAILAVLRQAAGEVYRAADGRGRSGAGGPGRGGAEHALMHALPRLGAALVHADPDPREGVDHHAVLSDHR
jgi:hypothetical protein